MKKELKTSSIVVIFCDDGYTPFQTISYDNFISYKYIDMNKLEVTVRTIDFPRKEYEETYVQFNIEPHNKHVLRAIENWATK